MIAPQKNWHGSNSSWQDVAHFYPARPKQGGSRFIEMCSTLYADDTWLFQPKFNGWRALLHAPTGQLWNRHGQKLSLNDTFDKAVYEIQQERERAMNELLLSDDQDWYDWYDVEALDRRHVIAKGTLIVLDMPKLGTPLEQRNQVMDSMFSMWKVIGGSFALSAYRTPCSDVSSGIWLWNELQRQNARLGCIFYEGVVAKRRASLYPLQSRSPDEESIDWVKHRFISG